MSVEILDPGVLPLTRALAEIFEKHYPACPVLAVEDVPGEDHIYARDEQGSPMFDMLVSTARRFAFVWYYIHPRKGIAMVEDLKARTLANDDDFVIKYPNVPVKNAGWPTVLRYGRHQAGLKLEEFIVKQGNPQLQAERFSDEALATYRLYSWYSGPASLDRILAKAKEMVPVRLGKNQDKLENICGYTLYAGCAYSLAYPHLGFGMRDIDVQVFFSPAWFTNTRCAFTRHCEIEEFGRPAYFDHQTRWLDLMWNSFHTMGITFGDSVRRYTAEMRQTSDRWATISQRPILDLKTRLLLYVPRWLHRVAKAHPELAADGWAERRDV